MIKKIEEHFETIIIGGGGAGLTAAIELAKRKHKVAIISKVPPIFSHTTAAQGGINANFGNVEADDWRWHMYDTVKSSDWLGDQDSIEIMCKNANDAVLFLQKIGVEFDLDSNGKIYQKKYGGQTLNYGKGKLAYRACSVSDRTGREMMSNLIREALKHGVIFINFNFIIDLIIDEEICSGVISYDISTGEFQSFRANNVIIATGGYSQIYKETTASSTCTGDGISLVANKGIALKDMEFVQFHPTALYNKGILISETARSLGGKLLNKHLEAFMHKYAPQYGDLATRDIVARAMATEINVENGCGDKRDHLYLDLRNIPKEILDSKVTNVRHVCNSFLKIEPQFEPIPVSPAAHYTMGGIPTNEFCEVINITKNTQITFKGLYAIGEAACHSAHGANRLGCNSLLDIVVFGIEVSKHILNKTKLHHTRSDKYSFTNPIPEGDSTISIKNITNQIKDISQFYLGMYRTADSLNLAYSKLKECGSAINKIKINNTGLAWNNDVISYFELKSLYTCAIHTCYAALMRKESRGSHYREDFPERDDSTYCKHSFTKIDSNGENIKYIETRKNTKDVEFFPLEIRNY